MLIGTHKKQLSLLIWFLSAYAGVQGQDLWPATYQVTTDSFNEQFLDSTHWQVLPDPGGNLKFADVAKPQVGRNFHFPQSQLAKSKTYWFRYRLKNNMQRVAEVSLSSLGQWTDFFLLRGDGSIDHYRSGWSRPWSEIDPIKAEHDVSVALLPGEVVRVYFKMRNGFTGLPVSYDGKTFQISILGTRQLIDRLYLKNESAWMSSNSWDYFLSAGFFLLAAVFNLFFFFSSGEKVYLFLGLALLTLGSQPVAQVFSREHPQIAIYLRVLSSFWLFFFLQFIRYFFETFRLTPVWDKIIVAVSVLLAVVIGSTAFVSVYAPASRAIHFVTFLLMLVPAIVTLAIFFFRKERSAQIFTIALLPFLLQTIIIIALDALEIIVPTTITDVFVETTLAWAILYFTRVLFRRYEQQQKKIQQQELERERLAREKEMEKSRLIEDQKIELERQVTERTAELKHSLEQLQATQAQLVHSEKMASLGELTAGIAHEIQNPLNFVNNFSEVNLEIIEELKAHRTKPAANGGDDGEAELLNDIEVNLRKIMHHGRRADGIVKSMLQHSRKTTGELQPQDINALVDEYLRLSYHGMRAKDKTFNCLLETHFDPGVGRIEVVGQEIGRVLLNLFNNAFYAVTEKKKAAGNGYEPVVQVMTRKTSSCVEISVSDNGTGIPEGALEKIYQPFFTTKPTGEGTGLGLSLSYDIIKKGHGGEMQVRTTEGEGTAFIVKLPLVAPGAVRLS